MNNLRWFSYCSGTHSDNLWQDKLAPETKWTHCFYQERLGYRDNGIWVKQQLISKVAGLRSAANLSSCRPLSRFEGTWRRAAQVLKGLLGRRVCASSPYWWCQMFFKAVPIYIFTSTVCSYHSTSWPTLITDLLSVHSVL